MKCVNAVTIGKLIEAHVDGDEKKFMAYAEFIAKSYGEQGDERAAKIIRNKMKGIRSESDVCLDRAAEIIRNKMKGARSESGVCLDRTAACPERENTDDILEDDVINDIRDKIRKAVENSVYITKEGDVSVYHMETGGELSDETIREIMDSENPQEALEDAISEREEWDRNQYAYDLLRADVKAKTDLTVYERIWADGNEDGYEVLMEEELDKVVYRYDRDAFNQDMCVNLMADTGDGNYDFARNNCLNEYGGWSGKLEDPSSILWLARQQDQEENLKSEMERIYGELGEGSYSERKKANNVFTESVCQELENNSHCCACLTFLINMRLFDLMKLKTALNAGEVKDIRIEKSTDCGLFAPFVGGGSCLEIILCKDVILPAEYVWELYVEGCEPAMIPYGIKSVYGMGDDAWSGMVSGYTEKDGSGFVVF